MADPSDEAYYKALIARVDDTITETREAGHTENNDLPTFVANEHSVLGCCFRDLSDSFTMRKRIYMLSLGLFLGLFLSTECSASHPEAATPWGTDIVLTVIFWQALMLGTRIVLQRAAFSDRYYIWPYFAVVWVGWWLLYDIIRLATILPDRQIYATQLFAATTAVNFVVEAFVITWRFYFFQTCCPCCVRSSAQDTEAPPMPAASSVDM